MHISDQALQEFKELYQQKYGVLLDDVDARDKASRVLKVMSIVYGPLQVQKNMIGGETTHGKTEI